jgi:hypothetical protein
MQEFSANIQRLQLERLTAVTDFVVGHRTDQYKISYGSLPECDELGADNKGQHHRSDVSFIGRVTDVSH